MTERTPELGRVLRDLGEHGDRLTVFAAAPEQLDDIGRDLDRAHRLLTAVRAEQGLTGCRQHPAGPVDTEAGGGCLLCATARRRNEPLPGQPGQTTDAAIADICRTVAQEGHDTAVRVYGPRAVARALLRCGQHPDTTRRTA